MADPNDPWLGVGFSFVEPIDGFHWGVCDFKGTGFDVDGDYFAVIAFFNVGTYLRVVDFVAASGKLFFAVAGLSNFHGLDLVSRLPVLF
jgi:hypothetical protein